MLRKTSLIGLLAMILDPACAQHVAKVKPQSLAVPPTVAPTCPPLAPPATSPSAQLNVEAPSRDQDASFVPSSTQTAHPSVTFVASGGYWESGNARGRYRVIVKTHCGEHCVEEVLLEQIDESPPDGRVHQVIPVRETEPMRVESVNLWPTGKWNGEVEFRLTDDDGKRRSLLCLKIAARGRYESHSGPCHH